MQMKKDEPTTGRHTDEDGDGTQKKTKLIVERKVFIKNHQRKCSTQHTPNAVSSPLHYHHNEVGGRSSSWLVHDFAQKKTALRHNILSAGMCRIICVKLSHIKSCTGCQLIHRTDIKHHLGRANNDPQAVAALTNYLICACVH